MPTEKPPARSGIGVDAYGAPTVDPTENVKDAVRFQKERQDDLLQAERRYNDLRAEHQRQIGELRASHQEKIASLRAEHQKELAAAESGRLDSIRQVDREDVAKTAASANLAIGTLAKQTTDLSTTLQAQVQVAAKAVEDRRTADLAQAQATAQTAEARRQAETAEVTKRVGALELALSASVGKSTVADPAMMELATAVKTLLMKESTRTGFDAGKAAAIAAGLAGATAVGGGAVALIMKLSGS